MNKNVHDLIDKVKYERQKHINNGYDVEMLVPLEFDVSQWSLILDYINQLEEENKQLKANRDEVIEYAKGYFTKATPFNSYVVIEKLERGKK